MANASVKYVISTLTNTFKFVLYSEVPPGQMPFAKRTVRILGGANRATLKGWGEMSTDDQGTPMWTPQGVVTPVKPEDWEWLKNDQGFKDFLMAGHLKVLDYNPGQDHNKVRRIVEGDMTARDNHAPLLKGDARLGLKTVTTGAPVEED